MTELLERARAGDDVAFAELVAPHRRELAAHCYRILGSSSDAEDAVQETLLAAWKGLAGFQGRSSLRSWLYTIATHASLRLAERRPARMLSWDVSPARDPLGDLGVPLDVAWVQPWIDTDPVAAVEARENIGLAYVAALQALSPNQRAVLILREVLGFTAAETAELLDTSSVSVNSALQRARSCLVERRAEGFLREEEKVSEGEVAAFIRAFEAGDVDGLVRLLSRDVRFTMPPLPAWFSGLAEVEMFLRHRSLVTPWRVTRRLGVNGSPGFLAEQQRDGEWMPSAVMALHRGASGGIGWVACFLDPVILERAGA